MHDRMMHTANTRGQVTNELESVVTAVVASADSLADAEFQDTWRLQTELGMLEHTLEQALGLVRRLAALGVEPLARLPPQQRDGAPWPSAGAMAEVALALTPTRDN